MPTELSRFDPKLRARGRAAATNEVGRFERHQREPIDDGWEIEEDLPPLRTQTRIEVPRSVITYNRSPDLPFDRSINPYRGCSHGCAYCYARPTHEYLGFSAGLDFESKIVVKRRAADLLRKVLSSPRWTPRTIGLSGNTDAYQPAERRLRITRRCLEVLAEYRNPVAIITKSYLVSRDIDILAELARHRAVSVVLSVTTLSNDLQRTMEPRASSPARRLGAIRVLADAGIPVGVNVAPVVPGLTEHEMPEILEAAADAGATFASYIVLRLPHGVKDIFDDWLERHVPARRSKVLNRVRELRGGELYDGRYAVRGRGEGPWADHLDSLFHVARQRLGLGSPPKLSGASFRRPPCAERPQFDLFAAP